MTRFKSTISAFAVAAIFSSAFSAQAQVPASAEAIPNEVNDFSAACPKYTAFLGSAVQKAVQVKAQMESDTTIKLTTGTGAVLTFENIKLENADEFVQNGKYWLYFVRMSGDDHGTASLTKPVGGGACYAIFSQQYPLK